MAKADAVIRAASTTRWDAGKLTVANGWNWPTAAGHTHSASDRFRFETERRRSAAGWQGCSRHPGTVAGGMAPLQISSCSEISSASSTSMPRYRTVDAISEWPSNSCTARRFLVLR